jgi:hypothetical protein
VVEVAVYVLAVWRVAFMLVYDQGPFLVFLRVRELFGVVHDEADEPISWPRGSLFACLGCMAVWVAIGLLPLFLLDWGRIVLIAFAVAGAAKLVQRWYDGGAL